MEWSAGIFPGPNQSWPSGYEVPFKLKTVDLIRIAAATKAQRGRFSIEDGQVP